MYRHISKTLYTCIAMLVGAMLLAAIPVAAQPYDRGGGTLKVPGTTKKLHYTMKERVLKYRDANGNLCQSIGIWIYLEDKDGTGPTDVTICAMANFAKAPNFTHQCKTIDWEITKSTVTSSWSCVQIGTSFMTPWNYFYHFGCNTITVPKNGGAWAFDGYKTLPKKLCEDQNGNFHEIELSDVNDGDNNTFDFVDLYVDALRACPLDPTCAGTVGNFKFLMPGSTPPGDYYNIWLAQTQIVRPDDPIGVGTWSGVSTARTEIGNWRTMFEMPMTQHPATFTGALYNAPAGSQLRIVFPRDQPQVPNATVYDSMTYEVPPSDDCASEPVPVTFNFRIPADMSSYISYRLILPTTNCGRAYVRDGYQVQLLGDMIARPGSTLYLPGEFIYSNNLVFLRDATPPRFGSMEPTDLDSRRLSLRVTSAEDASMMVGAYSLFTVNGGPEQFDVFSYENNDEVNDSTVFRDTLDFGVDSATVILRVVVVNELGLTDTSEIDTCYIYGGIASSVPFSPAKVDEVQLRHYPNPVTDDAWITFNVPSQQHIRLVVYDAVGRQVATLIDNPLPAGPHTAKLTSTRLLTGTYRYSVTIDGKVHEGAMVVVR